jgi:hypothetical protein
MSLAATSRGKKTRPTLKLFGNLVFSSVRESKLGLRQAGIHERQARGRPNFTQESVRDGSLALTQRGDVDVATLPGDGSVGASRRAEPCMRSLRHTARFRRSAR